MKNVLPNLFSYIYQVISSYLKLSLATDFISGCGAFSFNSQSVSLLHAYLLLQLFSSSLLAETGGKCPLVFSITRVGPGRFSIFSIHNILHPFMPKNVDTAIVMLVVIFLIANQTFFIIFWLGPTPTPPMKNKFYCIFASIRTCKKIQKRCENEKTWDATLPLVKLFAFTFSCHQFFPSFFFFFL